MFRQCAFANTRIKYLRLVVAGISGFAASETVAREVSMRVWWPIVAQVYAEIINAQKEREQAGSTALYMLALSKR